MANLIPITCIVAALLLPSAMPAEAATSTVDATVGYQSLREQGPQQKAREYDGRNLTTREHREADRIEVDISFSTDFDGALLDMEAIGLRSGNEDAFFDYTYGSKLRLRGSVTALTHRFSDTQMGMVLGGKYFTMDEAANGASPIAGAAYNKNNLDDQAINMRRVVTTGEFTLRDVKCPVWMTVGLWNEAEYGHRIGQYYNHNRYAQKTNRYTRDIKATLQAAGDKGYIGYEIVGRKFNEAAESLDQASTRDYGILTEPGLGINPNELVSGQAMLKNTVSGSYRFSKDLNVAAGATRRSRDHYLNGYTDTAHSGHAGVSYKPSKNWSFSGRFYARAQKKEETGDTFNPTSTQSTAEAISKKDGIDRYNYRGDMKMRYAGFKNVTLNFGYKPNHSYRRNAGTWIERATFGDDVTFLGNDAWKAFEKVNATEAKDTKHAFTAGVVIGLPGDSQMTVSAKEMFANRGGFQYMPTRVSNQSIDFYVPVTRNLHGSLSGGSQWATNTKASIGRYKRRKNWVLFGTTYAADEGKGSLGVYYGFEQGRDEYNGYWGHDDPVGAGTVPSVHIKIPIQTTNHTISSSGMASLTKKTKLNANAAYSFVKGDLLTGGGFGAAGSMTEGRTVDNVAPTDIRSLAWGVGLSHTANKIVTARVGFDQYYWYDNLLTTDNGQSQLYSFALSAKF